MTEGTNDYRNCKNNRPNILVCNKNMIRKSNDLGT